MGDRAIEEEQNDTSPRWQIGQIGARRIDLTSADVFPVARSDGAHLLGGMRRKHGEANLLRRQGLESLNVDCGLWQPHPLRITAKSVRKILDAPNYLRAFIPGMGKRQNHMVIALRHSCAMTAEALAGLPVGSLDGLVEAGNFCLDPGDQRGTEIEADLRVVIHDVHDFLLPIENARGRIGCVAFGGHSFVPIMVRIGGVLNLNSLKPGILSGRLIEVRVYANIAIGHVSPRSSER